MFALAFRIPASWGTLAPQSIFFVEFSLVGFYRLSSDTTIVVSLIYWIRDRRADSSLFLVLFIFMSFWPSGTPLFRVVWELLRVEFKLLRSVSGKVFWVIPAWMLRSDFRGWRLGTLEVRLRNFSLLSWRSKACDAKLGSLVLVTKLFFLIIKGLRVPTCKTWFC